MSTFIKSLLMLVLTISIIPVILATRKQKDEPAPVIVAESPLLEQPAPELPAPLVEPVVTVRQYEADLSAYERRDTRFRRFLAVSVQIGGGGSGTIIHYDPTTQEAYVLSCGHLWGSPKFPRSVSAEELRQRPRTTRVVTWYHDMTKLNRPRAYNGRVLFWSTHKGEDCALVKVKIDWIPEAFAIAPNQSVSG